MDEILAALAAQHAQLASLLDPLDEDGFRLPTPSCEGWTIHDVVLHLAQTDELAIQSARGDWDRDSALAEIFTGGGTTASNVDEMAGAMVEAQRNTTGAEVRARWHASADELRRVLAQTDPSARVQWVAGDMAAQTLATTRLSECWIHTDDVADALGIELEPTDRLRHIARLALAHRPVRVRAVGRATHRARSRSSCALPDGSAWDFEPSDAPVTVIRGDAFDLCRVAAQRVKPADTSLQGEGPDVDAVLELVRTYA